MSTYQEKLKDPRWQKRRLAILLRDDWACVQCGGKGETLHVHHWWYENGVEPWDHPDSCLSTLCESCHSGEHEARAEAEKELLQALRESHFLAFDISFLAISLSFLDCGHTLARHMTAESQLVSCLMSSLGKPGFTKLILDFWNSGEWRVGKSSPEYRAAKQMVDKYDSNSPVKS